MIVAAVMTALWVWAPTKSAQAADWIAVGQTADKSITLVDTASLRVSGTSVQFFSKTVSPAPVVPNPKKSARRKQAPVAYVIINSTANCAQRTLISTQWIEYGKKGEMLNMGHDTYPIPETVIPDSIGEAELNFVCSRTQN